MIDTIVNRFDIWSDAQGIKSRTRVKSVDNISLEGIDRLRELILDLAVSGKLVSQDPNDEPAQVLLKNIAKKKKELINSGLIKKQKTIPDIGDDEKPFQLPNGWEWARLDAVAPMSLFDGDWIEKKDQDIQGSIRLIQLADIGEGYFINKSDKFINEDTFNRLRCTELRKDDILIARLPSPIGRCCLFPDLKQKSITAVDIAILRTLDFCFKDYLVYAINSILFRKQIEIFGKGVTRFRISTGNLKDLLLPLPPFQEQERVASKVDELMALCDKLEAEQFNNLKTHQVLVKTLLETLTQAADANELQAAWERMSVYFDTLFCTEDSIDQLKQTILQLAIMGKLVKQDPNDEPANELLKKITEAKEKLIEEGKLKRQGQLSEISEDEKTFQLPKGWEWKRLNNVIDVRDGTHDSPKEAFGDNTYPLVTSQNFENGKINFDTAKRISESDQLEISKRSLVERYDILFSMIGGNLGNQVMVNTNEQFSVKNVALFKYYCKDCTSPYFIKKFMEYIALTLQSRAIGGAQPFVSLGFLRNIIIALPPIAEQNRIVSKIEELFTLCESLKEKIQKSQNIKVLFSKTIVEKAVQ